jgi:hypothetical protein
VEPTAPGFGVVTPRFGVALAGGAPLLAWQHRIVDELRAAGARDTVYYGVPAHEPGRASLVRRLLVGRAARRLSALWPAGQADQASRPWTGAHAVELDFVLNFGPESASAALGGGTRYGCWSFTPDLGYGLVEWYLAGQELLTVELRRTGPAPGESGPLHQGVFRSEPRSYTETAGWVFKAVSDWPVRALRSSAGQPVRAEPVSANGRRRAPVRMLLARTDALLWSEIWNVGVAAWPGLDPDGGAVAVEPRWLPDPPRGHYLADPFPLHGGADGATVIAEAYDIATRTGRLVTTRWDPTGAGEGQWEPAFRLRHHASYPFLVRLPEGTFCVPECLRSGELAAWRLDDDGTWSRAATLLSGRRLVDSTIIQRDSKWWIFATDEDRGSATNLYGWYAESFFGPWHPHPLNPLKTDVRSTRGAGPLFTVGDRLVRPAQDCSRSYGGRIVLNDVVRLDESSFEEKAVGTVGIAEGSAYPDGPHTLTFLSPDLVLVDGRRTQFVDLRVTVRRLPRRFANLISRVARRRR